MSLGLFFEKDASFLKRFIMINAANKPFGKPYMDVSCTNRDGSCNLAWISFAKTKLDIVGVTEYFVQSRLSLMINIEFD